MINFPPTGSDRCHRVPTAGPSSHESGATRGALIPHARALLHQARPAGGPRAAAPKPSRPRSLQPRTSRSPATSYLPGPAARPAQPPARPPAGATAAAQALPAGDPAPGPAPPGAGDPGERPSSPLGPRALGTAPGAPGSGHWSGGASPWCPRASPGPGSFLGSQVPHLGSSRRPLMPGQTSSRAKREKGPWRYPRADEVGVFKVGLR